MCDFDIPEDLSKLVTIEHGSQGADLNVILTSLKKDFVVLVRNVAAKQMDQLLYKVTQKLGLSDRLELQAGFAELYGHRQNIGKYFMTVNSRSDYQFISPHSEGTSSAEMQLASFYCYENSTNGGETILMNVDGETAAWQTLREKVIRGRPLSRPLSSDEVKRARVLYGLRLPDDILRDDDQIVTEITSNIPGLSLVEVLARPVQTYSCILDRNLYAYWDSVASIDHDLSSAYTRLLKQWGLLKQPSNGSQVYELDNAAGRRVWRSGIDYSQIFKCRITYKLRPGDLLIQNNVTWTHSASNWSPDSGPRKVAAAFA